MSGVVEIRSCHKSVDKSLELEVKDTAVTVDV
jgi:hypothetical protein